MNVFCVKQVLNGMGNGSEKFHCQSGNQTSLVNQSKSLQKAPANEGARNSYQSGGGTPVPGKISAATPFQVSNQARPIIQTKATPLIEHTHFRDCCKIEALKHKENDLHGKHNSGDHGKGEV
jgi:hypothetical protein